MTAVLQIRLFGGLDIRYGGVPVGGFVSNKAPALLAYLAVTGRPQQRETLAALLWGEMADADFGYVGSGVGKITLYKGKEVVKRNIDSAIAVDELINLLKESDAWVSPPTNSLVSQ